MESEWQRAGFIEADQGDVHVRLTVARNGDCTRLTLAVRKDGKTIARPYALLGPDASGQLRELLDRAAMPGQAGEPSPA